MVVLHRQVKIFWKYSDHRVLDSDQLMATRYFHSSGLPSPLQWSPQNCVNRGHLTQVSEVFRVQCLAKKTSQTTAWQCPVWSNTPCGADWRWKPWSECSVSLPFSNNMRWECTTNTGGIATSNDCYSLSFTPFWAVTRRGLCSNWRSVSSMFQSCLGLSENPVLCIKLNFFSKYRPTLHESMHVWRTEAISKDIHVYSSFSLISTTCLW